MNDYANTCHLICLSVVVVRDVINALVLALTCRFIMSFHLYSGIIINDFDKRTVGRKHQQLNNHCKKKNSAFFGWWWWWFVLFCACLFGCLIGLGWVGLGWVVVVVVFVLCLVGWLVDWFGLGWFGLGFVSVFCLRFYFFRFVLFCFTNFVRDHTYTPSKP